MMNVRKILDTTDKQARQHKSIFGPLCTAAANGTPLPEDLIEARIEGPVPFFRFRTRAQSVGAANDNQDAANETRIGVRATPAPLCSPISTSARGRNSRRRQ